MKQEEETLSLYSSFILHPSSFQRGGAMSRARWVPCPRCLGAGQLSPERLRELRRLGLTEPVPADRACAYCDTSGRSPDLVAELVPPHGFEAEPTRPPFRDRAEVDSAIRRLEALPVYPCRDDAWPALAWVLLRSP